MQYSIQKGFLLSSIRTESGKTLDPLDRFSRKQATFRARTRLQYPSRTFPEHPSKEVARCR